MPSVPVATGNLPSQIHELFLVGGNEDVGAAGPTILLRARDFTAKNFRAIANFAKQLGG